MCLSRLENDPKKLKKIKSQKHAWKVVKITDDKYTGPYRERAVYKKNVWNVDCESCLLATANWENYSSGYHCFVNRKSARELKKHLENYLGDTVKVVKVKVAKIVAIGSERFGSVLVCKKFKIVE